MPLATRDAQLTTAYRALADDLHRLLERKLNIDTHLVEDGLAFAWLRAYELDSVDLADHQRLGGWIYITARRRALELHRRHTDPRLCLLPMQLADRSPSPEQHALAREALEEIEAAVSGRQREVLRLLGEGYEPADIEQLTGQSKRTVRRLVDEGRARGRAARRDH